METEASQHLNVPASVLRQGKEADELIKKMTEGEAVVVETAEAAPPTVEKKEDHPREEVRETVFIDPEVKEHKYDVLKGKYDKEVPALAAQVRELMEANRGQNETIQRLLGMVDEAKGRGLETPRRETNNGGFKTIDKEAFAGYGEEVIGLVDIVNTMGEEMQGLRSKVSGVEGEVVQKKQTDFFSELDRIVSEWRDLNNDSNFLQWLNQKETPRSLQTRQELLDHYVARKDHAQAAGFFQDYLKESKGKRQRRTMDDQIVPHSDISGVSIEEASQRLGFKVVTKNQFEHAVQEQVHNRITEKQFNEISDNYQRTLAAVRAGKIQI